MADMIAFCGLNCTACPMFEATQKNSDTLRLESAKMLKENYGLVFKKDEINCDGCHEKNERLLGFCTKCKIRACGLKKGIKICSQCEDYKECEHLKEFHDFSPKAKNEFQALF